MIRNYLTVAWRNLKRNRIFSGINILGLSIGLTTCMLLTVYIWQENSFDKYQPNGDRLYQVVNTYKDGNGRVSRGANSSHRITEIFSYTYPQIEATARVCNLLGTDKTLLEYFEPGSTTPRSFYEEKGMLADSGFFRLFSYHFIEGSAATAMDDPHSIVLSKDIADKIFRGQPALNKVIHLSSNFSGEYDCKVTGVFEPLNKPSHIDGRFFLSMYGGGTGDFLRTNDNPNMAANTYFYTYLLLKPGTDPAQLERQFPAFVHQYEEKDFTAFKATIRHSLLKVRDIHLHANMDYDVTASGSITYLYILTSIALFTLLIACINFMNLATARSTKRSAEVGVRKTLGARRASLVRQFLGESLLMAFLAYLVAVGLTLLLLPAFERLSGKPIFLSTSEALGLGAIFLVVASLTGLIAGSYPAWYLSSFKPAKVLKGAIMNSLAVVSLRKGLVVFQFCISIVLIVAAVIMAKQLRFLRTADLGFNKDQQLVLPLRSDTAHSILVPLLADLQRNRGVVSAGASEFYPGFTGWNGMYYAESKGRTGVQHFDINMVDFNFMKTLGLTPVSGHLFSSQFAGDSVNGIILNETAARALGFDAMTCVGKMVVHDNGTGQRQRVVGVVKDFHFQDLHEAISGMVFFVNNSPYYNYIIVHIASSNIASTIASIGQTWRRLDANEPFEYSFLDDQFQRHYEADNRLVAIVGYATAIAILISCLGLFGLAAFSAEQRTKEIGIRKVLGASAGSIVALLSGDFLRLVLIAIVLGSPIGWWATHKWLEDFAYRIPVSWTVFAMTAGAALFIAFATVSFQAFKAATANPVDSLKDE